MKYNKRSQYFSTGSACKTPFNSYQSLLTIILDCYNFKDLEVSLHVEKMLKYHQT